MKLEDAIPLAVEQSIERQNQKVKYLEERLRAHHIFHLDSFTVYNEAGDCRICGQLQGRDK